jgi:hypothetical protein
VFWNGVIGKYDIGMFSLVQYSFECVLMDVDGLFWDVRVSSCIFGYISTILNVSYGILAICFFELKLLLNPWRSKSVYTLLHIVFLISLEYLGNASRTRRVYTLEVLPWLGFCSRK